MRWVVSSRSSAAKCHVEISLLDSKLWWCRSSSAFFRHRAARCRLGTRAGTCLEEEVRAHSTCTVSAGRVSWSNWSNQSVANSSKAWQEIHRKTFHVAMGYITATSSSNHNSGTWRKLHLGSLGTAFLASPAWPITIPDWKDALYTLYQRWLSARLSLCELLHTWDVPISSFTRRCWRLRLSRRILVDFKSKALIFSFTDHHACLVDAQIKMPLLE